MAVLPTLCDLTQSYAATGGGIRTYLHAKRAWLERHTDVRHVLIVPGPEDAVEREGRHVTHFVRSPFVPSSSAYRLLRNGHVRGLLAAERPDAVECAEAHVSWDATFRQLMVLYDRVLIDRRGAPLRAASGTPEHVGVPVDAPRARP